MGKREGGLGKSCFCGEKVENAGEKNASFHSNFKTLEAATAWQCLPETSIQLLMLRNQDSAPAAGPPEFKSPNDLLVTYGITVVPNLVHSVHAPLVICNRHNRKRHHDSDAVLKQTSTN